MGKLIATLAIALMMAAPAFGGAFDPEPSFRGASEVERNKAMTDFIFAKHRRNEQFRLAAHQDVGALAAGGLVYYAFRRRRAIASAGEDVDCELHGVGAVERRSKGFAGLSQQAFAIRRTSGSMSRTSPSEVVIVRKGTLESRRGWVPPHGIEK